MSTEGTPFDYSAYSTSMGNVMHSELQQHGQHLSPPLRSMPTLSPPHSRNLSAELGSRYPGTSPSPKPRQSTPSRNVPDFVPTDRSLPNTNVTNDTLTDAYVAFILYCNPNFALDVDTSTLRANFQSPPKSDGKGFEIYRLFELIKQLDAKEIKTWGQLALELGVEAPDPSKGQSAQKVQQYSVRLKRWMRAMHVDAFFEYLLGKPHAYYQDIPHPDDPYPTSGRDGVSADEDLAIRALDPAFRPKRGRRRNSEAEQDQQAESTTQTSQAAEQTGLGYPRSAYPASAYPSANLPFSVHSANPWAASAVIQHDFPPWANKLDGPQSAMATTAPSNMRWQTPATPHPMTAFPGSTTSQIDTALEPKSAVTPSARKRRKHGPAVSSAWPSTSAPGAKPRGRPPAHRNVQDGPFTTFPADPANDKNNPVTVISSINNDRRTITEEPEAVETTEDTVKRPSDPPARPGRLSLQVPRHTGGPVRLATPPRVMVTNETSESERSAVERDPTDSIADTRSNERHQAGVATETGGYTFEILKRGLASNLLRSQLIGRQHRLTGEESKRLADAVLQRLEVPRDSNSQIGDSARLTAASWLGLPSPVNTTVGQGKRIFVTRFVIDADGYEEILSARDTDTNASRETFDLSWTSSMGSCNAFFEIKGLSLADPPPELPDPHDKILDSWVETAKRLGLDDEHISAGKQQYAERQSSHPTTSKDNVDWKARYQALEFGAKMAQGEFLRYREKLIERVLETLI